MHPSIYHTKSLLHRHKFVLYPAETCSSSLARRTNTHEPRCPFCPGWILLAGWSCVGPAGPLSKGGTSYIHILLCISDTASSGVFPGAPATLDRVNANQLCGGGYTVQIEEPLHLQSIPASNPGVFPRSFHQFSPFSTLKLLVWRTPCIRRRFKAGGLKDLFPALLNSSGEKRGKCAPKKWALTVSLLANSHLFGGECLVSQRD